MEQMLNHQLRLQTPITTSVARVAEVTEKTMVLLKVRR
jgi:hypothetical protein